VADARFLLDSNICIYLLGGAADALRARIEQCDEGELATSTIAVAEVMVGARKLEAVDEAEDLFRMLRVYPFDARAAHAYAELPFRHGSFDRLIAAHALSLGLILVTNNERDYADLPALPVDNWAKS
jgi:tRNA(fMet)-specific endonuclease VapC